MSSLPENEDLLSSKWTFKYAMEGIFVTVISIFGLLGNSLSIYILMRKEVKLPKAFVEVLCCLSGFDNLFLLGAFFLYSLPELCLSYADYNFHLIAPYLYPITNTLLTCSSYTTVAVTVNRYLLIKGRTRQRPNIKLYNGYLQAAMILLAAMCVNGPRWLEFSCCTYALDAASEVSESVKGRTIPDESTSFTMQINPIRDEYEYIRDYTLISSNVLTLLVPMMLMSLFSGLVYREMATSTKLLNTDQVNDNEEGEQERRSRSLTFMLLGIIVLFILCRIGELGISIYELIVIMKEGKRTPFPAYIRNLITVNTSLLVCNSSFNFLIYYKDILFRRCCVRLYHTLCLVFGKSVKKEEIRLRDMRTDLP